MDGRILNGIGWNDIITEYLKPVGGLLLSKYNYETRLLSFFVPIFYKQILLFILYQGNIFRRHESCCHLE